MAQEMENIISGEEKNSPPGPDLKLAEEREKTPYQKEVEKYLDILKKETPEQLRDNLVKAGFLSIEEGEVKRGKASDSGMVLQAYNRALEIREKAKIEAEKEKYLSVLEKYQGDAQVLEAALQKQGILTSEDGKLLPKGGKTLEYQGYLKALEEIKSRENNTPDTILSQQKVDEFENSSSSSAEINSVDSDFAHKYPKEQ